MRLPRAPKLVQPLPHRFGVWQNLWRQLQQAVQQGGLVERGDAEALQQRVVMQQQLIELRGQGFGFGQVGHPDGAAGDLVLISWADAAAGGADFPCAAGFLTRLVQRRVQRQDQHGVLGDAQGFRA